MGFYQLLLYWLCYPNAYSRFFGFCFIIKILCGYVLHARWLLADWLQPAWGIDFKPRSGLSGRDVHTGALSVAVCGGCYVGGVAEWGSARATNPPTAIGAAPAENISDRDRTDGVTICQKHRSWKIADTLMLHRLG